MCTHIRHSVSVTNVSLIDCQYISRSVDSNIYTFATRARAPTSLIALTRTQKNSACKQSQIERLPVALVRVSGALTY